MDFYNTVILSKKNQPILH
jgi:hypothetical protein